MEIYWEIRCGSIEAQFMFHSCSHMLQAGHRKLSRHIAEDDEEMIKMKEYMEQKGL